MWCLHRFRRATMLLMSGIVLGSLPAIWPFREPGAPLADGSLPVPRSVPVWPQHLDGETLASLALAAVAALAVLGIDRLARRSAARL